MKEILVKYLDGTKRYTTGLEEQRKKFEKAINKKLSDQAVINALNGLNSYYTYELVDEKDEQKEKDSK